MITQCPACGTSFRVTLPQLRAQHGRVRCGRCAHVFDGFETLAIPGDDRSPDAGAQPVPVAAVVADERLPQRRGGGWALGVLLLLFALAAQGVYFYRSDIAARVPETRPYLDRMCELLDCTAALPQRPRLISIEASDMQVTDPANRGRIALTATLRNNAPTELGYPALDVVLTDIKDHTVARRVFLPAEYRDAGMDARAGIPPNAEVTVRLDIDSGDLGAAGFRLALLPAPTR